MDHFQGQYKSVLHCPDCGRVCVKFEPFMYASVPVPSNDGTLFVVLVLLFCSGFFFLNSSFFIGVLFCCDHIDLFSSMFCSGINVGLFSVYRSQSGRNIPPERW